MSDVFKTIFAVVVHTPLWVWALYALLLLLGLQRTRDSIVPLARMLILPIAVSLLAISTAAAGGLSGLPATLVGLVIGAAAGWQLERDGGTRRLVDGRLWLRGEWWTFGQITFVLVFRYVANVVAIMDPALNADPAWHAAVLFVSATLSAVFLGRTAARLRLYFAPKRIVE